ncbi:MULTISPECIES: hypothetical protein [unclassified Streptomyces]|uniref:hypothetical protein n=1 Tax=unclassified Streptomyces TaxID=2593676 RepID=UPI0004C567FF|nr:MULTISPECIES: hypothetical protein [unclassified Streptomyces]KOV71361.1 hypothetical protein ADL02_46325 [Streptomyces sp. NRRL WC-3723]
MSILDLLSINQDAVLGVAQAGRDAAAGDDRKLLGTLFPTRFRMVAAENGAPFGSDSSSVFPVRGRADENDAAICMLPAPAPNHRRRPPRNHPRTQRSDLSSTV